MVDLKEGTTCLAASVPLGATATSAADRGSPEGPQLDTSSPLPNGSPADSQQQPIMSDLSDSGGDDDILHKVKCLTFDVSTSISGCWKARDTKACFTAMGVSAR